MQTPWYTGNNMDPLATNYFTGGQMGYMPNPQYLTSPEYGAFRTPQPQAYYPNAYSYPSFMQGLMTTWRGADKAPWQQFVGTAMAPSPMGVNQVMYQAQAQRKVQDARQSFMDSLLDTGVKAGFTGIGAGLGALTGNPLGGAMLGYQLAPEGVFGARSARTKFVRELQNMTTPLITSGPDVDATGQGFSASAANKFSDYLHKEGASDSFFGFKDYKKFTGMAAASGMFDYSNSVDQYKSTMKKIRKDMLTLMDIFESADPADVFKQLQRLQVAGAGKSDAVGIGSKERMYSTMVGISHAEMVNTYGQEGALMYNQRGLTGYQGSLMSMSQRANIEFAKRQGLLTEAEISRAGGEGGMEKRRSMEVTDAFMDFANLAAPYAWSKGEKGALDKDRMAKLKSGNFEPEEVLNGVSTFTGNDAARFKTDEDLVIKNMMDELKPEGMLKLLYDVGLKQVNRMPDKQNLSERDKGILGLQLMKVSPASARQFVDEMHDPKMIQSKVNAELSQFAKNLESANKKMEDQERWTTKMKVKGGELLHAFEEWTLSITGYKMHMLENDKEEKQNLGAAIEGLNTSSPGWQYTVPKKEIVDAARTAHTATAREYSFSEVSNTLGKGENTTFDPLIEKAAKKHGIPANVGKAIMAVESRFKPNAVSPKGARGLMQLMPGTAAMVGYSAEDMLDPEKNIDAGFKYLKYIMDKNPGIPLTELIRKYHDGHASKRSNGPEGQAYPGLVFKELSKINGDKTVRSDYKRQAQMDMGILTDLTSTQMQEYADKYTVPNYSFSEGVVIPSAIQKQTADYMRAFLHNDKLKGIKSISTLKESDVKGGKEKYQALFGKGELNATGIVERMSETDNINDLFGEGFEENWLTAVDEQYKAEHGRYPSKSELAKYREKFKQISQNPKMLQYLKRSMMGNPDMMAALNKQIAANDKAMAPNYGNIIGDMRIDLEKNVDAASPQGVLGAANGGLSELLDVSPEMSNVYGIAALSKTHTKQNSAEALEEMKGKLSELFPDFAVESDGNIDLAKFKEYFLKNRFKDYDQEAASGAIDKAFKLAAKKSGNKYDVSEFSQLTSSIKQKKLQQNLLPSSIGMEMRMEQEGITESMLWDPKALDEHIKAHPNAALGKAWQTYSREAGDKADRGEFIYNNKEILTNLAKVIGSPALGDESKKLQEEQLNKELGALKAVEEASKTNTAASNALLGFVQEQYKKGYAAPPTNVSLSQSGGFG